MKGFENEGEAVTSEFWIFKVQREMRFGVLRYASSRIQDLKKRQYHQGERGGRTPTRRGLQPLGRTVEGRYTFRTRRITRKGKRKGSSTAF